MTAPADRPAAALTEDELLAIELRLAAVSTPAWKRLQHYIEDENDFRAHAQADVRALLLEVLRLKSALGEYADRSRWQSVAIPLTNGNVRLCATFDGGWGVADAALMPPQEES